MDTKHDVKNGYTQIAHTLLEQMAAMDLKGGEFRIILWVWRNSYGMHLKATKKTSIREIAKQINLNPGHVFRTMKSLILSDIIRSKDGAFLFNKYAINPLPIGNTPLPIGNTLPVAYRQHKRCLQATPPLPIGNTPNETIVKIGEKIGEIEEGRGGGEGTAAPAPLPASPSSAPVGAAEKLPEADIMAIASLYCDLKKIKFANTAARDTFLRSKEVFYAAKDILIMADRLVARAAECLGDQAEHYEKQGKFKWDLGWVKKDFIAWDTDRRNNE